MLLRRVVLAQGMGLPAPSTVICGPSNDVRRRMMEMELSMIREAQGGGGGRQGSERTKISSCESNEPLKQNRRTRVRGRIDTTAEPDPEWMLERLCRVGAKTKHGPNPALFGVGVGV